MSNATVLVVDDEKDLVELVRYNLEKEGHLVIAASDGASGFEIALRHQPDVVVLDVMLPELGGLDVLKRLRADTRTARVPIIMLTAKAEEPDRIVGLELGADDYVTKPFSPRELVARVKAVLRRSASLAEEGEVIRRGDLVVDCGRRRVTWKGKMIALTATEFRVLELLALKPGRVYSRDQIIDGALGRDVAVLDRTVDVHVTALRRKLGKGAELIETVRGFGYRLREERPG